MKCPARSFAPRIRCWEGDVRVLLVPNPANARSLEAARSVAAHLGDLGYVSVLAEDDAQASGLPLAGVPHAHIGEPELAIALGGDGTILKAVHVLGASDTPILGVNLGRLGFLSGAQGDSLLAAVDSALAGDARIERRQTLEVAVVAGGRDAGEYRALNEVFVGRGAMSRGVELELTVNDVELHRFVCDGLVIATPTGSTAYALSAGGPVLSPDVRGLLFVPVAPHAVNVRPVVFGPGDRITVSCPNPARADACVSVDGDHLPCRSSLDRVEIRVGERDVRLLKLDGRDFYSTFRSSFLGA